jgi:hypothetical protein
VLKKLPGVLLWAPFRGLENTTFVVFSPWCLSLLVFSYATDHSDTDFFNKLSSFHTRKKKGQEEG